MSDAPHPDLARRLKQACEGNPDVSPLNHGRLGWFTHHLEREGVEVTQETVRKWFAGESRPRHKPMAALAKILKVDEFWLGSGKAPEFSDTQRRQHNAIAGGVVNVVAGFIQMDGGHPAFPQPDDQEAIEKAIHLYAILRGAKYNFHILPSLSDDGEPFFIVPLSARETIVLGVHRVAEFEVEIYELDWEAVETVGTRKSTGYQVPLGAHPWRPIKTFAERI